MNTAPIDDYEGAADIFTFGGGSFGMWLFIIVGVIVGTAFIVRMIMLENHAFAEVDAAAALPEADQSPIATPAAATAEPVPAT